MTGLCVLHRFNREQHLRSPPSAGGRAGLLFFEKFLPKSTNAFLERSFAMATIRLAINGHSYSVDVDPQTSLLTVLREHLDLTGSKYGCGEGQCGACTVLVDGKAQRSCMTKVGVVGAKQITTIEGIANGEQLHPVQQAFLDAGAMQCAYCTSGMIVSAVGLLKRNPAPKENEIIEYMDGNVCRCGTYPRIVSAIQNAARVLAASGTSAGKRAGR
jgi:aerobic-type carbon monoxide dehydrogenase small subunit (CoxS/CutS family)